MKVLHDESGFLNVISVFIESVVQQTEGDD